MGGYHCRAGDRPQGGDANPRAAAGIQVGVTTLALPLLPGAALRSALHDDSTDLVERARGGDAAAFAALYRAHAGAMLALCLRLTGDRRDAEERLQDVWVRCWERLGGFRGESAFRTWLHRLAVNEVLSRRRAEARRERRVAYTDAPERLERPLEVRPGERIDLEQAIARLPEGARMVFVLHDIEGYGHAEIGAMSGIAEGTSKAQLFRARRLLREALER